MKSMENNKLLLNKKTKPKSSKNKKSKKVNRNNYIGPWTIREDRTLINLVEQYGPAHWNFISNYIPGRTGKQCRERWCNHLCPNVNKSSWSLEEEMILLLLHNKIGNKWSEIAKYLKGRTDNTIKNHWNSTMQKRLNFVSESLKNKKIEIKNRYKENNEENLEKIIIEEFISIIDTQMKKIIDMKQKNYENFKKMKIDFFSPSNSTESKSAKTKPKYKDKDKEKDLSENNNNIIKLRKILGFRTHSKKRKKANNKNRSSSSTKKLKRNQENKNNINSIDDNNEYTEENNEMSNDKENNFNYKTPDNNRIITKISSSLKDTEDYSDINKMFSGESNLSAFHCINREDNLCDKRYVLSHKYTPIKVITTFDIDKKNDNKGESRNSINDNSELRKSKQNLNLLFNNFE